MTSYLIFDKTSNAANFNATIFGASGARIAQPSGATRQALEVVNLGTSNALRVRSGAQHNAIVVGPSGNVGLGTATPVTPLHIHAQATYVSGGNVGIGTTAPIANLHVQGDTQLTGILSAGELRPNGLIAWLPFAGHLFDLSGSNIIGAPTIGSASATPSAATATTTAVHYNPNGREGTSLVGVNPPGGTAATYVTYPIITAASAALPSPTAPAGFAVAAWVRPYATATTGNRQFFFGTDGGYGAAPTLAGASILAIGLEPTTNYPVVLLQPSQGSYVTLTAPVVIPLNAWTHFTVTLSGTAASPNNTLTLYINGTAQGTVQSYTHATAAPAYLANLILFNGFTGATNAFHGELDTVQVYQRLLTTAEIATLSTASSEKTPAIQAHSIRVTGALQLSDATTLDVTPTNSSNAASTLQVTTSDYQMRDLSGNIASVPDVTNGKVIPVPFGPFANSPNEGSIFLDNPVTNPGSNGTYLSVLNSNTYGFNWWQNGGFTAETWVNLKTIPSTIVLLGQFNPIINNTKYWSLQIQSGITRFYYWNGSIGNNVTGVSTLSINTWYHISVTCDAGSPNNIRLFVNGSLETTAAVNGTPVIDASFPFTIGDSQYPFNGYIANTRLVRGAALYTATFTPPTAPLGPATSGTTVLLLRAAKFQRTPLQLTSDGRLSVAKIKNPATSASAQQYPPIALTSHLTNVTETAATYGRGYYIATASSETDSTTGAWRTFGNASGSWGTSNVAAFQYSTTTPFTYTGSTATTDTAGTSYTGEWVQLQLPSAISLSAYTIIGTSGQTTRAPKRFYVLGSRDGAAWTRVSQQSEIPFSAGTQLFTVGNTQAYQYYRLVTNQLTGNGATLSLAEWTIFGTPEGINVTSDGRVGVGVVNPTQALEVAGNAVFGGNISAGNLGMFRNRIINGDMRIAQRGTSSTSLGYATVDRFQVNANITTGVITQTQQTLGFTDLPYQYGFKNSWKCTATTACTNYLYIEALQYIEGYNVSDFNWGSTYGSPITISMWFKANWSGDTHISIRTYPTNIAYLPTFTSIGGDKWQYISFIVPPPPYGTNVSNINTVALMLIVSPIFSNGIGSQSVVNAWATNGNTSWTSGVRNWAATLNNYIEFTGLQLEKGTLATPFEFRPYPIELQLCQRYYYIAYVLFKQYIAASGFGHMVYPLPTPFRSRTGATVTFNIILGSSVTAGDNGIDTLNVHLYGQNTAGGAATIGANGYLIIISEL